jgi:hypothetical protein
MTAKTALIHIGTPKTGTTSIQECLARAEVAGSLRPYRYPLFRGHRNHNRLTMLYLSHDDLPKPRLVEYPHDDESFRLARRRYRQALFEKLHSAAGAILSGEVLGNALGPLAAGRLRNDLESIGFQQFYVPIYIRDPADFYLSSIQQTLKRPFHRELVVADPRSFRYSFRHSAENWEQVFPGSVIVRQYPNSAGYDVIEDFSQVLQRYLGIAVPPSKARLNTTISAEAMVVMQEYREAVGPDEGGRLIPDLDRLVAFLAQSRQRIPQTKPVLNAELAETIRASHRQDAEFIKSRYGVDLGLGRDGGANPLAVRSGWRVEDILESVDLDVVERLSEEFRRAAPPRRRPVAVRVAARAYRAIPYASRPARLEALLRNRFTGGSQG